MMARKVKQILKSFVTYYSSRKNLFIIFTVNKPNTKTNLIQRKLFFSFSNIIKMDIPNNTNDQLNNCAEEENPGTFEKLKTLLDEKQIKYTLMEVKILLITKQKLKIKKYFKKKVYFTQHAPTKTSEESAKIRGTSIESGAKAILLKGDRGFALIIISAAKKFNNKAAKKLLNTKNLRFAELSEVKELTVISFFV